MSVTEALFGSEPETIETASADARTVGLDAAQEEAVGRGAAEVCFVTMAEAEQQEAHAWEALTEAAEQLEATLLGKKVKELRHQWSQKKQMKDAIKKAEALGLRLATGCSRRAVPCGQADHLRQCLAAGAKPTANEAN